MGQLLDHMRFNSISKFQLSFIQNRSLLTLRKTKNVPRIVITKVDMYIISRPTCKIRLCFLWESNSPFYTTEKRKLYQIRNQHSRFAYSPSGSTSTSGTTASVGAMSAMGPRLTVGTAASAVVSTSGNGSTVRRMLKN